jgi:hypothetical protein
MKTKRKVQSVSVMVLAVSSIFMLAGCSAEGKIVSKEHQKAYTSIEQKSCIDYGEQMGCTYSKVSHPATWQFNLSQKTGSNSSMEQTVDVTQREYETYQVGDYYAENKPNSE